MSFQFHLVPYLAVLLVSCDKPEKDGDSIASDSSNPRGAPSSRPRLENSLSRSQQLRVAFDKAMEIETIADRDQALAEIVRNAVEIDAALSAEAFQNLSGDSLEKPSLLDACARRLVARSQDEALAWAEQLGANSDILAAKGAIAIVLAESEPSQAVKILEDLGVSLQDPEGAAVQVIQAWGASAPKDAATWAVSVTSVDSRRVAIKAVASQWLMADSQAALIWMASLSDPSIRQEVSQSMAESLIDIPEPIRESILQNADPKLRKELDEQVQQLSLDVEGEE